MPASSRRQQRYLYARFGEDWVKRHGFDKIDKVKRRKKHLVKHLSRKG